jgi:hypothetical protein
MLIGRSHPKAVFPWDLAAAPKKVAVIFYSESMSLNKIVRPTTTIAAIIKTTPIKIISPKKAISVIGMRP